MSKEKLLRFRFGQQAQHTVPEPVTAAWQPGQTGGKSSRPMEPVIAAEPRLNKLIVPPVPGAQCPQGGSAPPRYAKPVAPPCA